ncbi:MAG TPA: penicillin-binding protein 1C [Pseudomonadota bacterium]|nr:penicillin-binding protein 1C [Pseudomonadota bacterium]
MRLPRLTHLPRLPRLLRWLLAVIAVVLLTGIVLRLVPAKPLSFGLPLSTAVYDKDKRLLRLTLADDEQYRLWVPLSDISPQLVEAVLLHEDRHFYHHFAVNPVALSRALWTTYVSRERRVGGSTISMQVARMKYHLYSRSAGGKLRQIGRALWLELRYSKAEILEAYLNLVPVGKNIQGVGAASFVYFGKPPSKLQLGEALTLAVIPQSPARRAPDRDDSQALQTARAALFQKWVRRHPSAQHDADLIKLKLSLRSPHDLPFRAPHLVDSLLTGKPSGTHIETTIDLPVQSIIERQIHSYIERQKRIGIENAAAMLVDTRDMSVRAVVGSAGYFRESILGQVNGTLAKRSPGSTLKPFIYGLAIDQGVLHPQTMLKDSQLSFGAYSPENFDGKFAGPLSAQEALVRSRNVPALWVASKLSNPTLYEFLKTSGVSRLKSESHYGLALVLGGAEVTMEELAMLYAVLPGGGLLRPLRYQKTDPQTAGVRVLSAEASFVTLEMLKENPRPEDTLLTRSLLGIDRVAWKTGTSYGFHDAWTAGVIGPYVLVVWLGNFNGDSNPAFVGVTAAAPLYFSIIDALRQRLHDMQEPSSTRPPNLKRVAVCAISGQMPGRYCKQTKNTWFVPGRSPIDTCEVHRPVEIDTHTGLRACPGQAGQIRSEVYEFWPSDLLRLFRIAGLPRRTPPPYVPGCNLAQVGQHGMAPKITSPLRGVVYTLRPGLDLHDTIGLTSTTDADVGEVFWFANDKLLGKSRPSIPLLWRPQAGQYVVRVVDDQGRADSRQVLVRISR